MLSTFGDFYPLGLTPNMDRSAPATNSFPYQPFSSHTPMSYPIMTSTPVGPHPVYAQQHVMTVANEVTRSRPSQALTSLSTEVSDNYIRYTVFGSLITGNLI